MWRGIPGGRLKALTLRQPYAWLVVHGPKNIENRRWQPWEPRIIQSGKQRGQTVKVPWRGQFIIHAGAQRPTEEEWFEVRRWALEQGLERLERSGLVLPPPSQLDYSAFIGTAVLVDVLPKAPEEPLHLLAPWRLPGQLGWVLDERRALAPLPHPGKRGLWECHYEPEGNGWRYAPDHYP